MLKSKTKDQLIQEIQILKQQISQIEHKELNVCSSDVKHFDSSRKYQNLFESFPIPYQSLDVDGRILDINQAWLDKMGYQRQEVIGRWFGDFISKESHGIFMEKFPCFKALGMVCGVEFNMQRKDGTFFLASYEGKISKDERGDFKQTHCIFMDITEQKARANNLIKAKEAAERKKIELDKVQQITHIGSWYLDLVTNEVVWTEELYKMYGFDSNLPPPPYTEHMKLFTSESWEILSASLANTTQTGTPYELELVTVRKDKSNGWMWVRGEAVFDQNKKIIALWGVAQDITERKQIELELAETAERFKALHNASFGGIAIHDKGIILECNQGLSEITGYSLEELIGMDGLLLIAPETREMVMNNIIAGYEKPYEAIGLRKNGQKYSIRLEARNIPYKGKNVRTVEFRDITEQKKNEQELVLQAYRLNRAQEIGHIGHWDFDVVNNVLKWSVENYKIFGIKEGTPLTFELFLNRVHPEDRDYVNTKWQNALNKQPYEVEHRLLIEGLVKWVWQKAELEFDDKGACLRAIGFTQDITERKKNEEEIKNINKLRLLYIENSPIYTFIKSVTSTESRVLLSSNNFNEIIGGPVRNINGKTMHELFPAEFANKIIDDDWNIIVSGKMLKIDENFGERNYTSIKFPIIQGDRKLLAGYTIDITELKKSEEVAKKEQTLSNAIIESIPGTFYMLDETGKYVRWNAYQRDEIVGKPDDLVGSTNALDTIKLEDRGLIQSKIANVLANGVNEMVEGRVLLRGGPEFRWLLMTGCRMLIEGRPFLIGIGIDITERKQVEEALQISNKRFEELFDNMSSGVVIYMSVDNGSDFIIKDFNNAAERIEKINKADLIGKRITEVFPGVKEFGFFEVLKRVLQTGEPEHFADKLYKDNRIEGWRRNYVYKIFSGEVIAVYDDITEEKKIEEQEKELVFVKAKADAEKQKAEELAQAYQALKTMQEQLLQAEKMSSIGQLGAGIAHELNSPLAGILSLIQSYKKEKDLNSEEYMDLFEMEKAAEHMTKIIKGLNAFSRQSTGEIEEVNCNETIDSVLSFTEYQLKIKAIRMEMNLNPDLWKIRANKNQIQQIIINMISNACDASFINGKFNISTGNVKIGEKSYVEMQFADSGIGIPKENLKKIFDPFFTTKRPGGGVGLGLSIVYKIVENYKGIIDVDSRENQGAIFTIRLLVN
jgi:PAS domain S-box-containing protein